MELLGSLPRIPPIELDSTNGSPIAELSASPISPSQRNPNIHPDTGLTPGLSGDGGLSITTPEGVILKPNLTSDCAQGYQPGPADHVTSFMDFQTNETSPKGT